MKQLSKTQTQRTLDESIANLQTLAAKQAWYVGSLFGACGAAAIFKYSENSGLTGFFTMAMVIILLKHLYNLGRFRGHKLEFTTSQPSDV
ncbi:MAG: hypothetical protein IIB54_01950 [Planctomycetes bacterium]|nr:hypothetical protein [Planctomycetota bacterium]